MMQNKIYIVKILLFIHQKVKFLLLPRGATAYDFAYNIHTDVGNKATQANINKIKKPLLTQLKSGDIVSIVTGDNVIPRCTWQDMVKTTKAIKSIKALCHSRLNNIDQLTSKNIINTIFSRYKNSILDELNDLNLPNIQKIVYNLDHLKAYEKNITRSC